MLLATSRVFGCSLENGKERVGTLHDLLFDDVSWAVRYMVVDAGGWLDGRRVLLAPSVVDQREWPGRRLWTELTQQQVKDAPPVDADLPVSRQNEIALADHYAWGYYWGVPPVHPKTEDGDPHLRSARAVTGYRIQASDGEIGHVEDLILDDEAAEGALWEFRYLVVDTRNWMPGRKVLIAPLWADEVSYDGHRVSLGLSKNQVRKSPEYTPDAPINREYEEVLFDYYGRPKYWIAHAKTG
jgi:hypothetical protein